MLRAENARLEGLASAQGKTIAEISPQLEAAHAVLKRLSDYQHLYAHYTWGDDMPGNWLYSGMAMAIVREARELLGPASEDKLTADQRDAILVRGHELSKTKEVARVDDQG